MDPQTAADSFARRLRESARKERAVEEQAYLKSDLQHLGASVPQIRAAAKDLHRSAPDLSHAQVVELVRTMWKRPIHECRVGCVELLWLYRDELRPTNMALLEKLLWESKTWALVDSLAVNVTGDLVERYPQLGSVLDRWARHDDFWIRRSAMLALLKPLRRGEGDFERFAGYADAILEEKEFFISKAIGWVLRETAKKQPDLVHEWLVPRTNRASGVTMREAVKPLSSQQAEALMAAYRERKP